VKVHIKSSLNLKAKTACLVVALKPLKKISSQQSELNAASDKLIDRLQDKDLFSAKQGEVTVVSAPAGLEVDHLVLLGTGAERTLGTEETREVLSRLARKLGDGR